jgi:hypothetical protein
MYIYSLHFYTQLGSDYIRMFRRQWSKLPFKCKNRTCLFLNNFCNFEILKNK